MNEEISTSESVVSETDSSPDLDLDLDLAPDTDTDDNQFDVEKYVVKINGVEKEVTRKDLIDRYQKEAAAGERFEEAAELKRQYQARQQHLVQHEQNLNQIIGQLDNQARLWATEQLPDWQNLLETNPHEYLLQKELWAKRAQTFNKMREAQEYQARAREYAAEQQMQEHLRVEGEKLIKVLPEWKDKVVRERERNELVAYVLDHGYSEEDVEYLDKSKAENIALVRKAMLYDRAVAKTKALKQQDPEAARPVPTVGKSARSANSRSIGDPNLSFDDFARLRREQIARRR